MSNLLTILYRVLILHFLCTRMCFLRDNLSPNLILISKDHSIIWNRNQQKEKRIRVKWAVRQLTRTKTKTKLRRKAEIKTNGDWIMHFRTKMNELVNGCCGYLYFLLSTPNNA